MKREEKDLLIKDLCARLPYGVKCYITEINDTRTLGTIQYEKENSLFDFWNVSHTRYEHQLYLSEFKPYLFPLSSMTEEQKSYLYFNTNFEVDMFGKLVVKMDADDNYLYTDLSDYTSIINWLIENKFDYQGLIPMGLAIDATGLNIY